MGLSGGSKTTTVNTPSPQAVAAGGVLTNAYNTQAPRIQALADQVGGLIPSMIDRYRAGDSGVNAARGYITSMLGSDPQHNPNLDAMIAQSGGDVAHQINSSLGTRGNLGGSVQAKILADQLSRNSLNMRYSDYDRQQQLRAQAAGMAPGVAAADTIQIAPLLSATQLAGGMPIDAATRYAAAQGSLFGGGGTQTTTQNQGIGGILGSALGIASLFSDERLKTDIRKVGATEAGLPIYTFRYQGAGPHYMGVMAQDVAREQPTALGPVVSGYGTVRYEEVR
jgi:hypothetical protein